MIIFNIITLIIWAFFTIVYFANPMDYDIPNWFGGCMGLIIVLSTLADILEKLK